MNIGIIIHSFTGNTMSVADQVKNALAAGGHTVTIEKIGLNTDYSPQKNNITITAAPSVKPYDAVIFGAPVEGFSLSPVMKKYLEGINSLENKRAAVLITQFFPFAWMGGNRATAQLTSACTAKGADIVGNAIVNWAGIDRRARKTADAVTLLSSLF